ncbi:glycosyltransferase [Paenibacillus sp. IHB B 3415]|uniref:glycosyltransferase family 2 protein n=1 Tax=Paenibacillus sp. IHB B 3415 TaxID=867080 RepID=UPI0005746BC2|nr:glycosyltransferase family A protein [Paenibacillus sp. IHB B 3415]KHL96000.1 glycosyltransferase [Paenibacillus sp. IHB B 3415]
MKVSVIIPMYNSENTITNTLNSVKIQTAYNEILEIIVINDGSTDDSLNMVNDYILVNHDMPIILIDKMNGGVSSARNAGMKISMGEWIALLDSDDEWLPNKIEVQLKTIEKHPYIDFLGGDSNGLGLRILFKKIDSLYKASVKDLCLKSFPVTPAAFFRRKIINEIGYFDEEQKYAEDGNYFLRICAYYNYYHLPIQMVNCGGGKPTFGYSGLSANLKGMYDGNVKNIKDLKRESIISIDFYLFLRLFFWAKYIRRIIISKLR